MDRIFYTKTALLAFVIERLSTTPFKASSKTMALVSQLKQAFEDHHYPDVEELYASIQSILKCTESINNRQRTLLQNLLEILTKTKLIITQKTLFENPTRRRFESELTVNLLTSPTTRMMNAVEEVSRGIVKMITMNPHINWDPFVENCLYRPNNFFGYFHPPLTLSNVCNVLLQNKRQHLANIIMVHMVFWYFCKDDLREETLNIPAWVYPPLGEFAAFVKTRTDENYIEFIKQSKTTNELAFLSDELMYKDPLYQDRGRGKIEKLEPSCYLGLMLPHQPRNRFQTRMSPWFPDVEYQYPDPTSAYFNKALKFETVYVAGPSGLATVLLSMMEILGNFPTTKEKQYYLLACVAYLGSGGIHSIQEVLEPAQYFLKLIPGLNLISQDRPPNFSRFFSFFKRDPQFAEIHEQSWKNFLNFLQHQGDIGYKRGDQEKWIADKITEYSFFNKIPRYLPKRDRAVSDNITMPKAPEIRAIKSFPIQKNYQAK